MPAKRKMEDSPDLANVAMAKVSRSYKTAKIGVRTTRDLSNMLTGLMFDLVNGTVSPPVAGRMIYASGRLCTVYALRKRYGGGDIELSDGGI